MARKSTVRPDPPQELPAADPVAAETPPQPDPPDFATLRDFIVRRDHKPRAWAASFIRTLSAAALIGLRQLIEAAAAEQPVDAPKE